LLPRGWIQEIKHMMTVHSTHGLFLTCTQILFVFTQYTDVQYSHNKQAISFEPLATNKEANTYLEGQLLARGDEFPSTLAPSLVTTASPFSLHPFHPFPTPQPTLHCLQIRDQQSWSSSSGTLVESINKIRVMPERLEGC
jgi:hypothetical protein